MLFRQFCCCCCCLISFNVVDIIEITAALPNDDDNDDVKFEGVDS